MSYMLHDPKFAKKVNAKAVLVTRRFGKNGVL